MKGIGAESLNVSIEDRLLVKGLDFWARTGEVWVMLGANGAGKTTLLHTLAGLREVSAGRVNLDGKDIRVLSRRNIARRLGVLLQHTVDAMPSTVLETALLGTHATIGWFGGEGRREIERAHDALKMTGLTALAERRVDTLSGGERRRLALATVFVQAPHVILLDEPTNHLDLKHQFEMLELIKTYAEEAGAVVIMILHDVNQAVRFASHAILLFGGGEVQHGRADELLTRETLSRLYGRPIIDTTVNEKKVFVMT